MNICRSCLQQVSRVRRGCRFIDPHSAGTGACPARLRQFVELAGCPAGWIGCQGGNLTLSVTGAVITGVCPWVISVRWARGRAHVTRSRAVRRISLVGLLGLVSVLISGCSSADLPRYGWPEGVTPQAE